MSFLADLVPTRLTVALAAAQAVHRQHETLANHLRKLEAQFVDEIAVELPETDHDYRDQTGNLDELNESNKAMMEKE